MTDGNDEDCDDKILKLISYFSLGRSAHSNTIEIYKYVFE
jgi:hypothetical protein